MIAAARTLGLAAVAMMLLPASDAPAAVSAARLHHYSLSPQAVSFTVTGTGCTREQDFELLVEQDGPTTPLRITVLRLKPDWCKKIPQALSFTLALPRRHAGASVPVVITNGVTPGPGKMPK